MIRLLNTVSSILLLLAFIHPQANAQLAGQECFPKKESKLVYDVADVLTPGEEAGLERMLVSFSDSTSNQLTIVVVPDLCGMEKAQFAIELGQAWGVGQASLDNGIVMLVKPKTPQSKGEAFIAVGRGLEGAIPDITAKNIIENECITSFKRNNYYDGIKAGAEVLMELAKGEYSSKEYASKHSKKKTKAGLGAAALALLIIFIVFFIKATQVRHYARTNQLGFWAAWALLNATTRSHRGYYSNFSSGRGGFGGGGFGGGGFGGFGGGGFGGGGAGGSW